MKPARKTPLASAAAVPAEEKPVATPAKPKKAAPAKIEEEDPFAVDQTASAGAIPISPKPIKGRTIEVVCPMCETAGFISPKAAGQLVKCCNPQCLVPTFTAPAAEKKPVAAPPPPERKGSSGATLWAIIAAIVVVGLGVFWYFGGFGGKDNTAYVVTPTDGLYVPKAGSGDPDEIDSSSAPKVPQDKAKTPGKTAPPPPASKSRDVLTKAALDALVEAARKASPSRKAYCRRLAAVEYAQVGDLKGAAEQLERLKQLAGSSRHEAVLALAAIAWHQMSEPAAFDKTVAEALSAAKQLPPGGRYCVESTTALAAVLAAAGRIEDAQKALLFHHNPQPATDALAAALQVTRAQGTFNLDASLMGRSLDEWQSPLDVAVTLMLASRQLWDPALAWAKRSPAIADECVLVWAEALAEHGLAANLAEEGERAAAAAAQLAPAANARFLARVAALQFDRQNPAGAEEAAQKARAVLAALPVANRPAINGIKQLMQIRLPDSGPLRMAAFAHAELGGVEARLGQMDASWNDFSKSLAFLRCMTPSPSIVARMQADIKTNGQEGTRQQLYKALDLKTEDEARRSLNLYKQRLTEVLHAATVRFQLETKLLTAAVNLGLLEKVGQEMQSVSVKPDLNEQEPFAESSLATLVLARYEAAGKMDERDSLASVLQGHGSAADPLPAVREKMAALVEAGEIDQAADEFADTKDAKSALDEWALRLACRLVKAGKSDAAMRLLSGLKDVLLAEDGLQLIAGLAAREGEAEKFLAVSAGKNLSPTESAAVNAGIIEGLTRRPQEKPADAAPAPAAPPATK